jgi:TPR repeat protein
MSKPEYKASWGMRKVVLAAAAVVGFFAMALSGGGALAQETEESARATLFEPFADLVVAPPSCKRTPYRSSREELLQEASAGKVNSMLLLAASYFDSEPRDEQSARFWYAQALKTGNSFAQWTVGNLQFCGQLYPQDYEQAVRHIRAAAEAGERSAARQLGTLYELGIGVEKDPVQALTWYRKADSLHYARALYKGVGVPADPGAAFAWLKRTNDEAESEGHGSLIGTVKYNLALLYLRGEGVARDEKRAFTLLQQVVKGSAIIAGASHKKAQILLQIGPQKSM